MKVTMRIVIGVTAFNVTDLKELTDRVLMTLMPDPDATVKTGHADEFLTAIAEDIEITSKEGR